MKFQNYKLVSKAQIAKIHVLLQQHGLLDEKPNIGDGRTESTKELTCDEAKRLISLLLNGNDNADAEKRKAVYKAIYGIAWKMGVIYGSTNEDYQMNKSKLNVFCRERGTVKKNLSDQNLVEMRMTHRQFEAMLRNFKRKKA